MMILVKIHKKTIHILLALNVHKTEWIFLFKPLKPF